MLGFLSSVAGGLLGGGSDATPIAPPIPNNQTASFGSVSFGAKYAGDEAVKAAPAIVAAESGGWTRFLPWIVAGVVGLFAILFLGARRR